MASLSWDPNMWRWIDGGQFLNYTTKDGRETIINRNPCTTCAADKWQGYLMGNYNFYWSHVWDPLRLEKEAAFIWSRWHKYVDNNKWRARIAPAFNSRQ
jgi:hypothetical protein